ncbi:MAG: cobyric acid synthase [Deltaproteobacteria bacterium]
MLQSTQSHAGKTLLTAALLRILNNMGVKAAPFKAQNMALNSFVTEDGGEIGRAQAFQAEAARIKPSFDMNPILLKPTTDSSSQVIIHGRVYGVMGAKEYHRFKKEAMGYALASYERLSSVYDVIVLEGAGSPAEVNLRENDIANMGIAEAIDSPVLLIGDIDRGGVFASIIGTLQLLSKSEKKRVKGFIINKFRGDIGLLRPGLKFLEAHTKKPVLGVVPYIKDGVNPEEDSQCLDDDKKQGKSHDRVNIVVIKVPRISNFTDFDPFKLHGDVGIAYASTVKGLRDADAIMLPGSKNTIEDMRWLRENGFFEALKAERNSGKLVFGICGGFQMLGRVVHDPHGVESKIGSERGIGLLDAETVLMKRKNTHQVEAEAKTPEMKTCIVKGYEIHMGETNSRHESLARIFRRNSKETDVPDGAVSEDRLVWGTYMHGIFDNDGFRRSFINHLRRKKGLSGVACDSRKKSFASEMDAGMERIASIVEKSVSIEDVLGILGHRSKHVHT